MKIVERVRGGGTGVTAMELEAVREDWLASAVWEATAGQVQRALVEHFKP